MENGTIEANDRELKVNLAIYDFHEAIERGDAFDPALWAARDPEIASELAVYLADLEAMGLLAPRSPGEPPATTAPRDELGPGGTESARDGGEMKIGDMLGQYVLLTQIDKGGQGIVWKARPRHSREIVVAIKTLKGPAASDTASVYRLREDARAIARMKHPNIIGISYFGEDRGRWFFAMEFMEGGNVASRLGSYGSQPRASAVLIEKIARAIHHAHTRNPGVLHLDLKPGNILLSADGDPKVTDFGLSVRLKTMVYSEATGTSVGTGDHEDASATFAREGIVGTIPYMSPEMAAGRWSDVSTASDVYGLGAILYALLTGRAPFRGRDDKETLWLVVHGELVSARELNRNVDHELNSICLKCLDRTPENRYGSADALANDLRRWLECRPSLAGGKPSAAREVRFWVRRHPLRVAFLGLSALLIALATLVATVAAQRAENGRDAARLASQIDRELRLIKSATHILASDPRLHLAFASFPSPAEAGPRQRAIEAFLRTAFEHENLFGITGGNPFANVFVLEPDGVLRADTMAHSPAVGTNYAVRDYYRALFEPRYQEQPDYVYVARSFRSAKDGRYKIAVSTRICGDRGELLGVLVANFTIGPRLIDVDMHQETSVVAVLCPMDESDPARAADERRPPWHYIHILDRHYDGSPEDRPITVDSSLLPDFQGDLTLAHATAGPAGGRLVDYQRVGHTHMIVIVTRNCPFPLSWLPEFR
jgi:hypothetical protein